MKNIKLWLGILAIMLVFGIMVVGCDNGTEETGGTGGTGGTVNGEDSSGRWRTKKVKLYTVTNGVASVSSERVYNWITYRYTSDTNYEYKYTETTGSSTAHETRNGQNYTYETTTTDSSTQTKTTQSQYLYDSASGLPLQYSTRTQNSSGTTTTTYSSNIQLISDSGGVKTYKSSYETITENGNPRDLSYQGYSEHKIQNGRTIEQKSYSADGVLLSTNTYTLSDNPVIKAKLGDYTLTSFQTSTSNSYETVEVLSDSATELVIRRKTFTNNVLSYQTDTTYEKVN